MAQDTTLARNQTSLDPRESENSFVDSRDNQEYKYVNINGIQWMADNLNYKSQNSLTYNNNERNSEVYGRLYNWKEAKSVCPSDWRLPTEDDWQQLEESIGLSQVVIESTGWRGDSLGNQLKKRNEDLWFGELSINQNDIGFKAISGGVAFDNSSFANLGKCVYYWSATNYYSSFAWSRYLSYDRGDIFRNISAIQWYFSVRCVKE